MELVHRDITQKIIGAAYEIYRTMGYGFLEKVYQKAMQVELQAVGVPCELEKKVKVFYRGATVGDYEADLFVGEAVIVELKVAKSYNPEDEAQLLNELKATGVKVGLLINFGRTRVEFKRLVF